MYFCQHLELQTGWKLNYSFVYMFLCADNSWRHHRQKISSFTEPSPYAVAHFIIVHLGLKAQIKKSEISPSSKDNLFVALNFIL